MSSRLILSGLRSIEECLKTNPARIAKLLLPFKCGSTRIENLRLFASKQGVKVETNPNANSDEPVLAMMKDYQYVDFDGLINEFKDSISRGDRINVLMLDGITDSHNLGAIIRTAAFTGMSAIIIPKDKSAAVTDTVYRIASGGMEYIRISQVTNLVSAIKAFKEVGFWIIGFSEHSEKTISDIKLDFSPVIVIGNEENGIRPLVREHCDFLVKLVNKGQLTSLNASVAASLAMAWATDSV